MAKVKVRVAKQGSWQSQLPQKWGLTQESKEESSKYSNLQPWCLAAALLLLIYNSSGKSHWDFWLGLWNNWRGNFIEPSPVWRALYKFMLCWLNTSAVQTAAIRLVAHTHGSQGLQRGCQERTLQWAGAQGSSSWHKRSPADLIPSLCSCKRW